MTSVLEPWVEELSLMMQGTLMTCIRGCDTGAPKVKPVARWLRSLLLVDGNPENDFQRTAKKLPSVEDFEDELEMCPVHYFAHFLHSLEIVGYKHPDSKTADTALDYYLRLCSFLHLAPETEQELDERLSGSPGTTGSTKRWVRRERRDRRAPPPKPEDAAKSVLPPPVRVEHYHHGRSGS